jgi:2,4-dienoyl-CoA reductase-like NADH-dependent reductase (Old Yellow Enzyme family)
MRLAKRYAPKAAIFANGSLHNIEQAVAALDDGADIITIGRGALANPDLPRRLSERDASTTSTRRSLDLSPTSRKRLELADVKGQLKFRRRPF